MGLVGSLGGFARLNVGRGTKRPKHRKRWAHPDTNKAIRAAPSEDGHDKFYLHYDEQGNIVGVKPRENRDRTNLAIHSATYLASQTKAKE